MRKAIQDLSMILPSRGAMRAAARRLGLETAGRMGRHLPDRLAHPLRRRRALRDLRRSGMPRGVLFICQGNIYRSPYAAIAFREALPPVLRERSRIESAGFVGPDRPCPPDAKNLASRRGLDLTGHRSSLVSGPRIDETDLVVVMQPEHKRAICARFRKPRRQVVVLGDLDSRSIRTRAIRDPWGQPPEVLEDSYSRIDRCIHELVAALLDGHAGAAPHEPDRSHYAPGHEAASGVARTQQSPPT